ncbi:MULTISPECIES: GNAT family N-acetyltransferase [Mammaliicoccus]|uniref:GNAT family N-acetyltransferase n=1 Tax=Mammaliicoccus fleurettii TaxID=150056 RepID=A0ABS5MKV2_9STAP|nr:MULTISPECIES: GNAT family N-acetyltransferase [Mammaliicoccus]MBL0846419.1 GNAT family N-acetyltransferase [Mammaliicoccus fleurettii]MBS3671495.1 GNAT family N-acetyltransferase [Mammaliicoccus fleurettii]MBS3696550.1 GNAT family N-acetyltransferase [Mammaliicoccus fleurettii]MBW0765004.1 GNAT family N-acetyltransferase [Mammaliicoccus fleurettii]MEB6201273.1 GNAT family N-acetyltransferase [Mammaliicoccus fleurettii]
MQILPLKQIDPITSYLYEKNLQNNYYIEYIPTDIEEIKSALTSKFNEQSFYYIEDNNNIIGILGFEKIDDETVNVWGPIVNDTTEETLNALKEIWEMLLNNHRDIKYCHISLHKDHILNNSKLKRLHAGYVETQYTLEIQQPPLPIDKQHQMTPYSKPYYYSFDKLHSNNFKHSDISSRDIVNSLGENHALYLYIAEGLVKGYIYLSIDIPKKLATIPNLASHHDYRKQGIAFQMIHFATNKAFTHDDVETVRIYVDSKKHEQIQLLYEKVGFKIVNETHHFKYVRPF